MAEVCVTKSVRLTPQQEYKLIEMQELSGLSQSEIVRMALDGIKVIREKPSKELMNTLLKLDSIGAKLLKLLEKDNISEEDRVSLKVCATTLHSTTNDVRKKYL